MHPSMKNERLTLMVAKPTEHSMLSYEEHNITVDVTGRKPNKSTHAEEAMESTSTTLVHR
jgi:hypothetical protein